MSSFRSTYASPIGPLQLTGCDEGLTGIYFDEHQYPPAVPAEALDDLEPFVPVTAQLGEYFSGSRTTFEVALAPQGTPFQRRVWSALLEIPYGVTESYGELARRLGDANLTRAVGLANGRNPISIIVPCHRVVGADGSLTGYGGGLERKRWLLVHEGALLA